tara:strand:+ start:1650 stop:1823 length:174 start_codon:yes stop_codon:yes gene_type:complete
MMQQYPPILMLVLVILIALLLFIFMRGVILWYFKIEKRLEEQKKTNKLLEEIKNKLN